MTRARRDDLGALPEVVGIVREHSRADAQALIAVLVEAGMPAIEVTLTTPEALEIIRATKARWPQVLVGVGTVTEPAHFPAARAVGADFAVSPFWDDRLSRSASINSLPFIPGALTPTEVARASRVHSVVKLFPAGLGGIAHLRALRDVFPGVRFLTTGGASLTTVQQWLDAGAWSVGLGGALSTQLAAEGADALAAAIRTTLASITRPAALPGFQ